MSYSVYSLLASMATSRPENPGSPRGPLIKNKTIASILSGLIAAVPSELCSFPLSRVKTVKMTQGATGGVQLRGFFPALQTILRNQGFFGLYKGFTPVAVTGIPAYTLLFGSIHATQEALGNTDLANFLSGWVGQGAAQFVWTGSEIVKERMQMNVEADAKKIKFRNLIKDIWKNEGVVGFYRGFGIQYVNFGLFNGLGVWGSKKFTHEKQSWYQQFVINLACFALAAGVTNPLDVTKTRMQVRKVNPEKFPYKTSFGCAWHTLKHEGPKALVLAGIVFRMAWLGLNRAIGTTAYSAVYPTLTNDRSSASGKAADLNKGATSKEIVPTRIAPRKASGIPAESTAPAA